MASVSSAARERRPGFSGLRARCTAQATAGRLTSWHSDWWRGSIRPPPRRLPARWSAASLTVASLRPRMLAASATVTARLRAKQTAARAGASSSGVWSATSSGTGKGIGGSGSVSAWAAASAWVSSASASATASVRAGSGQLVASASGLTASSPGVIGWPPDCSSASRDGVPSVNQAHRDVPEGLVLGDPGGAGLEQLEQGEEGGDRLQTGTDAVEELVELEAAAAAQDVAQAGELLLDGEERGV